MDLCKSETLENALHYKVTSSNPCSQGQDLLQMASDRFHQEAQPLDVTLQQKTPISVLGGTLMFFYTILKVPD